MRAATTSLSAVSLLAERKLSVSVRALLLENVRNLLDMDDGETFREVIPELFDSPHFEGNSATTRCPLTGEGRAGAVRVQHLPPSDLLR